MIGKTDAAWTQRLGTSRKILIAIAVAAGVGLLSIFLIIPLYMHYYVGCYCDEAANLYDGDAVEALIAYLESDRHTAEEKNHIVWTLGEMRDRRALPVLRRLLDGDVSDQPGRLSRYEVEKAIGKIEGRRRNPYFWK